MLWFGRSEWFAWGDEAFGQSTALDDEKVRGEEWGGANEIERISEEYFRDSGWRLDAWVFGSERELCSRSVHGRGERDPSGGLSNPSDILRELLENPAPV